MQVVLEPIEKGWRASTGAPLEASAEAATDDEAVDALLQEVARRLKMGVRVIEVATETLANDPLRRFAGDLKDDPLATAWEAEVRAYRAARELELSGDA